MCILLMQACFHAWRIEVEAALACRAEPRWRGRSLIDSTAVLFTGSFPKIGHVVLGSAFLHTIAQVLTQSMDRRWASAVAHG